MADQADDDMELLLDRYLAGEGSRQENELVGRMFGEVRARVIAALVAGEPHTVVDTAAAWHAVRRKRFA